MELSAWNLTYEILILIQHYVQKNVVIIIINVLILFWSRWNIYKRCDFGLKNVLQAIKYSYLICFNEKLILTFTCRYK